MLFRAEQHLRRPGDIRAVRERGQRLECRAFTVWWKQRGAGEATTANAGGPAGDSAARVCVIASTSAVGNAVRRNRAKRRLREVFRHRQTAVPSDCDLLLIARRAVNEWRMTELETAFTDACRRMTVARR